MQGFFESSHYIVAKEMLLSGEPPLITQLLVLNTVFFIFWMLRRMRGAHTMRYKTAITLQSLLVAANCFVILNGDFEFFDMSRFAGMFG